MSHVHQTFHVGTSMHEYIMFAAGAVIGGLLSWLITHQYYIKASKDQHSELTRVADDLRPKITLQDFEKMLETSTWTKTVIDQTEIWIAEANTMFQIVQGEQSRDFKERWTEVYPDPKSTAYPVFLKIAGSVIKEITFISMDGGRIFVPMPDIRPSGASTVDYFWNLDSLEVKLCRIIGNYYIYKNLEGVASHSKVTLVP
jgi:hypothetical protein